MANFVIYDEGNLIFQFQSEVHIKEIGNEDCTIVIRSGYSDLQPTREFAEKILNLLNEKDNA